jgi:hypothetical protein
MGIHSHERAKVTFDCSLEEKIYIKMLAAKSNMTLGEFVLSYLKVAFPSKKKRPNKATLAAHKEALEGKGTSYESMDDFWADMGVTPRAKS